MSLVWRSEVGRHSRGLMSAALPATAGSSHAAAGGLFLLARARSPGDSSPAARPLSGSGRAQTGDVMVRHEAWQLEGSAAELYERHLVPAITSLWAADLVERAAPQPGERVLDVACGTGIVARRAAERMGSGRVVGLDINPGMLAVARALPPGSGPAIEWHEGSVLDMPFPEGSFDVCLCQLGLQFFPDRAAALREMRRVLRTGGRLTLSVFSALEDTAVA